MHMRATINKDKVLHLNLHKQYENGWWFYTYEVCDFHPLNNQNTSIVQSISLIQQSIITCSEICWSDMLQWSLSSMLNSSLWSRLDAIINACDPMQNPGQTHIFYKADETLFIHIQFDWMTQVTQMIQPSFNPGIKIVYNLKYFINLKYVICSYVV